MSFNSSNPWGPNEPSSTVHAEEGWLQGESVSATAYGAELVLFLQCFILLLRQTKRSNYKRKLPFLVIVCLIFTLGTFFMGSDMKVNQLAFIEDRNFPGGPNGFENVEFSIPINIFGNVSAILSYWLCDALLIWRYMVIYKGCRVPMWVIMTPPVLVYLGSLATGILLLLQTSSVSPFFSTTINWAIPFFSINLALNILVAFAIVARLLVFRRRIASALSSTYGTQYTSIAAMIIESSSLFCVFLLLFIVPFAINSPIAEVFLQCMSQVQSCATLLIIYRAASGKAWSTSTQQTLKSMHFDAQTSPGGTHLERGVMASRRMGSRGTTDSLQAAYLSEEKADSGFMANRVMFTTNTTTIHTSADTNSSGEDIAGAV